MLHCIRSAADAYLLLSAGDSACSIPPQTIPAECLEVVRDWTIKIAKELKVVGLINIQYCIQDNQVDTQCFPCHSICIQGLSFIDLSSGTFTPKPFKS